VRVGGLLALAFFLAVPTATADPPWSPPRDVGAPSLYVTRPSVAFGTDGAGVVVWNDALRHGFLSTVRPDGTVVQNGRLRGEIAAGPLVRGRRTLVLVRTGHGRSSGLSLRFGTTSGPRATYRRIRVRHPLNAEDLGAAMATGGGDIAVAWVEFPDDQHVSYRIAFSRGGRFSSPRTIARIPDDDSQSMDLAYGPGRRLIIAYAAESRGRPVVAVRTHRPGHGFGRPRILGARRAFTDVVAAASPRRALIAWGSEDSDSRPWTVRASLSKPGGRFGGPVTLDAGHVRRDGQAPLHGAVGDDGTTAVTWNLGAGGRHQPISAATAPPGRGFGRAKIIGDGYLGGVAVDRGRTLVVWTESGLVDTLAALRPAGAAGFGPPERASGPGLRAGAGGPPAAAFSAGRPVAIWPAARNPYGAWMQISIRAG
jgi:hypothetical protein